MFFWKNTGMKVKHDGGWNVGSLFAARPPVAVVVPTYVNVHLPYTAVFRCALCAEYHTPVHTYSSTPRIVKSHGGLPRHPHVWCCVREAVYTSTRPVDRTSKYMSRYM